MIDLNKLVAANAARWKAVHIRQDLVNHVDGIAFRLVSAKARYQAVETATHVPWAIVAVIHERESSQSWLASLAQGDPFNHVSIHVPKGRGPFSSWEEAAIDALDICPPHAARWQDWSIGGALTLLEQYNGLGYAARGIPSPYVWAATDQYRSGKYIADGHFDPQAIDRQIGCAALLMRMIVHDLSIKDLWHP